MVNDHPSNLPVHNVDDTRLNARINVHITLIMVVGVVAPIISYNTIYDVKNVL